MKLVGCAVVLGILASCVLFTFTALYAAGGLQAALTLELVPFVGPKLGPRVEAWVLGATEELTVEDAPLYGGEPLTQTVGQPYTGTVEARPECKQPKGWPARGAITQGFHPGHGGIDISMVTGTPIQTTMCGTIVFAGQPAEDGFGSEKYGTLIIIANSEYKTYYAHLSQMYYMPGDQVEAGLIIGASGNTGNSTGPHLHYEVRLNGERQDPWPYMQLGEGGELSEALPMAIRLSAQGRSIGDSGHYAKRAETTPRSQVMRGAIARQWAIGWAHARGRSEITAYGYSELHIHGGTDVIG